MLMDDKIYQNLRLATMCGEGESTPLGIIDNAAMAVTGGVIAYAGPANSVPEELNYLPTEDMNGLWALPSFIDCHTHLVFAGDRSHEHALRASGASYEEISRAGGGIRSTVADTRAASDEELLALAITAANEFIAQGVGTLEIKSGYGLSLEHELKQLRVAGALRSHVDADIEITCLAAHAVPPEFDGDADGYINLVCDEIIPAVAEQNIAGAVDAFMEGIGFTAEQTAKVFTTAKAHGLNVKLHADQLSDLGGAKLAAEYGALSADHLEYTSSASIKAMQSAGTVAVLLPGAFVTLKETQLPPIAALREAAVPMALASDYNPGSNPSRDFMAILRYGVDIYNMTPDEVLLGVTKQAAMALGLADRGTLEVGNKAHISFWDIRHPHDLTKSQTKNPLHECLS